MACLHALCGGVIVSTPAEQINPLRSLGSFSTDYQRLIFTIAQMIGRIITIVPVRVVNVYGAGDLDSCPYVDLQPLLDQRTGSGVSVPHLTVYKVPAWRMQSGSAAVVLDPLAGDVGLALVSYRDSSALTAADQSSPGSLQGGDDTYAMGSTALFDWGCCFYLGGWLNGEAQQFIQFLVNGSGDPNGITITSVGGDVTINDDCTIDTGGNLIAESLKANNGATGSFTAESGQTITVTDGIITNIS